MTIENVWVVKDGVGSIVQKEIELPAKPVLQKGVDPEKLKQILLAKNIITDVKDVE